MTDHPETSGSHQDGTYEIRIRGRLDARWAATLGVASLTHESRGTILRGTMDQPALHGLLERIRDLSLPLISVIRIDPDQSNS